MGMPNNVKRSRSEAGGICRWCGTKKRRIFAYNNVGFFCNLKCWMSYYMLSRREFDYIEFDG